MSVLVGRSRADLVRLRLKQAAVLAAALVIAAVMVRLGWWQFSVYEQQANGMAQARAAEPARPLTEVAPAGELPADGYGRTVTFTGAFRAEQQFLVPVEGGGSRVLTALQLPDGSTVPVVRGVTDASTPPAPPTGSQQWQGVLLASDAQAGGDGALPAGQLASVRLSEISQSWPGPLVNGYVTLDAEGAGRNDLAPAEVALPQGDGRLRNGIYAAQWFLFALFGMAMTVKILRDMGVEEPTDTTATDTKASGTED